MVKEIILLQQDMHGTCTSEIWCLLVSDRQNRAKDSLHIVCIHSLQLHARSAICLQLHVYGISVSFIFTRKVI